MLTLDHLLSGISIVTVLLVFLITAVFQGWLDKGKLVIRSTAALILCSILWITYRSFLDEYGPLEWNRLKLVGVALAGGVALGVACSDIFLYIAVSVLSRTTGLKLNQGKKVHTWVVILICFVAFVWAYITSQALKH